MVRADDDGDGEGRDMDNLFPLLFLMGGAPAVLPAVWLLGALMLGAMYFMAR